MPIQHTWAIPYRSLIIGTALAAVSVLGTDVNWEDNEVLREKMELYIKANCEYEANLQKYEKIAEDFKELYDAQIAVCIFNGKIRELVKKADKDGNLEFITVKHPIGHKTYIRTATMMMLKALYDVLGKEHVGKAKIEFTIGDAYYCSIKSDIAITEDIVKKNQ